jgi:peptidyl-prolyl cis-trans isomerase B (cyclophilin B)
VIRTRLTPLVVVLLVLATACGSGDDSKGSTGTASGKCSYPDSGADAAKKVDRPPGNPPADLPDTLTLDTSAGSIPITLEAEQAPCAVNAFASLADQGYFDNTKCHRLTTEGYYVLQCGDPSGTGSGSPGYRFADELVANDPRLQPCGQDAGQDYCTYNTGTVAMANAGPDTNGSQFFLVYGNSKFPPAYTVLGHMDAAGLKVVKDIAAQGITPGSDSPDRPGDGTPKVPVTITTVK